MGLNYFKKLDIRDNEHVLFAPWLYATADIIIVIIIITIAAL